MYYINDTIATAIRERGKATTDDFAFLRKNDAICMWRDCGGDFHIETMESDAAKIAEMAKEGETAILSGKVGIYHRAVNA